MTDHERAVALRRCVTNYSRLLWSLRDLISNGKSEAAVHLIDEAATNNGEKMGWRGELGIGL
jgi:hypothetical protein